VIDHLLLDLHAELQELAAIKAESIGWLPLEQGVYLHHGDAQSAQEPIVIQVVGLPDVNMAGMNVLLVV
jgi:hypothetical protein